MKLQSRQALQWIERVPPFRDPRVQRAALHGWRRLKRYRRVLAERHGSAKYSKPALYDLDRRLERYLDWRGGTFVEAGANDGFRQSNTYFLERFRGWRGVLVEPVPELADQARRERPSAFVVNCALVGRDFSGDTISVRFGGLTSAVENAGRWDSEEFGDAWTESYEVEVPVRTLSSLLVEAEVTQVDFLSLDVEGYEVEAIGGLDLERTTVNYLLIEIGSEANRRGVEQALGEGYVLAEQLTHHDYLYVRKGL